MLYFKQKMIKSLLKHDVNVLRKKGKNITMFMLALIPILDTECSCAAGKKKSVGCAHSVGLLYTVANYK